jgi:cytochrome c biogenesis protein CcmG, thiol:disulfide interchange protein DsbE
VSRRPAVLRALAAPVLLALLAGCNPSLSPPSYRPPDASLVSAAALAQCPTAGKAVSGGLPKLTLHCLGSGPSVDLAGLRGPALVNTWYSSCEPCQNEAHLLNDFAAKAGTKVLLLGVDSEAYPDPALQFAINQNVRFASVTDQHSDFQAKAGVTAYPTTYFVDAAGHVVGKPMAGPFTSLVQIEALVRSRLGVTVS